MFTALVTFLVTITMLLGGAGAPVEVILDNLPSISPLLSRSHLKRE